MILTLLFFSFSFLPFFSICSGEGPLKKRKGDKQRCLFYAKCNFFLVDGERLVCQRCSDAQGGQTSNGASLLSSLPFNQGDVDVDAAMQAQPAILHIIQKRKPAFKPSLASLARALMTTLESLTSPATTMGSLARALMTSSATMTPLTSLTSTKVSPIPLSGRNAFALVNAFALAPVSMTALKTSVTALSSVSMTMTMKALTSVIRPSS